MSSKRVIVAINQKLETSNLKLRTRCSALLNRHHVQSDRTGVLALRADQPIVGQLLQHVSSPASRPRDGKDRREQVGRNAERVIDRGGIEIDVGVEVLLLEHEFGNPFAHLNPFWFAELRAE